MSEQWVVKHRPKTMVQIAGNKEAINKIWKWVFSWMRGVPKKHALLLHGPAGVGKTVSAEVVALELGFDLVEVNASDKRNRDAVEKILGMASGHGVLFDKPRLLLIDEVDGVNPQEDRGAVEAIVKVIESSACPIILTANDVWNPKIASMRKACEVLEFKRLGLREAMPWIKTLMKLEGITADEEAVRRVYDANKGDMRGIVNDLQNATLGKKTLTLKDLDAAGERDRKDDIFKALGKVFSARDLRHAREAIDSSDVDYEMLFEWIYENIPRYLTDPRDLENGMENLAKADLFLTRAQRNQAWSLLSYYFDLMTGGLVVSKNHSKPPGWVPNRFPERIQWMSRTRKLRSTRTKTAQAVAKRCHLSSQKALTQLLPYLNVIMANDTKSGGELAHWLQLGEEETEFLKKDCSLEG